MPVASARPDQNPREVASQSANQDPGGPLANGRTVVEGGLVISDAFSVLTTLLLAARRGGAGLCLFIILCSYYYLRRR